MIHLLIKIYLLSILGFYEYSLTNLFQIVNKVMLRTFHASSFFSNAYMIEYFSMNVFREEDENRFLKQWY